MYKNILCRYSAAFLAVFFVMGAFCAGNVFAYTADDFVITVDTNNVIGGGSDTEFTIPTRGINFNYDVDCNHEDENDIKEETGHGNTTYTCTYGSPGIHTIVISGNYPSFSYQYSADRRKVMSIEQWGTQHWSTDMTRTFYGCTNMVGNATDTPDFSGVIFMPYMFSGTKFNGVANGWDVSNVTDMSQLFAVSLFNQDIGDWDTSSVENMSRMFGSTPFNQDISEWETVNVMYMDDMFSSASDFDQPIGDWDTSNVINMNNMFGYATSFDQPINFDTTTVGDMGSMFSGASAFNQSLDFNTSNVINMEGMFNRASAFNQDIGNWETGTVENMHGMFDGATAFNQDIGDWDTTIVYDMNGMFSGATAFNQDIGDWTTGSVEDMGHMFGGATAFNQDIGEWNTAIVDNMEGIFSGATAFNQDISDWETGQIEDMGDMFRNAASFNQDIGNWDTGSTGYMAQMFSGAISFDQDLSDWDVENIEGMEEMFDGVTLSTANYDATLIGWNNQSLKEGVNFSGGNSVYCAANAARANMIESDNWSIEDGGQCAPPNAPDLHVSSDSGVSDIDDITNDNMPLVTAQCATGKDVRLYVDEEYQTYTECAGDEAVGMDITAAMSDGGHDITYTWYDNALDDETGYSPVLEVTIDTENPTYTEATPITTLTSDSTPDIELNFSEDIDNFTSSLGCMLSRNSDIPAGDYTFTVSVDGLGTPLADGEYNNGTQTCYIVDVTDVAGNTDNGQLNFSQFTIDTTLPILTEITPVPNPTSDTTPDYTFNTNKAGKITYEGSCSSATVAAAVGDNAITFDELAEGVHSDCKITVTAPANTKSTLTVKTFEVKTTEIKDTPTIVPANVVLVVDESSAEYKRNKKKYKNTKSKQAYNQINWWKKKGTIEEKAQYEEYKNIFKKYKGLSKSERKKILTPAEYEKYKMYRAYKGYKEYKKLRMQEKGK